MYHATTLDRNHFSLSFSLSKTTILKATFKRYRLAINIID